MDSREPPLTPREESTRWKLLTWTMKYQFARFLMVGGTAALANVGSASLYRWLFDGTPYYMGASFAMGFSVGTVVSFPLNKFFTFQAHDGNAWGQFLRFILVGLVSIALGTLVAQGIFEGLLVLLAGVKTNFVGFIAQVITIAIMTVFNFFIVKHFAFAGGPGAQRRGPGGETSAWGSEPR
jgi:putative flippase GtrA